MAADDEAAQQSQVQHCSDWLLRVEEDLSDASCTFLALSWAVSSLRSSPHHRKRRRRQETAHELAPVPSLSDREPVSASLLRKDSAVVVAHENVEIRTGGHRKEEENVNIRPSSCEVSVELEAMLIDDDGNDNEEEEGTDLMERVKLCESGESAEIIAVEVREKLAQHLPLVNLIEQCLLLSLDQEKPSHMKETGKEQAWLLSWLLKDAFCNRKYDLSSNLDWLLAYLSSSFTCIDLFYLALWDVISAKFLLHSAERTVVPLSILARIASVLEYTNSRHGELAASTFLSSFKVFINSSTSSSSSAGRHTLEHHEEIKASGGDLIGFWLIMGFVCPGLFSSCINLLTATFDVGSMRKWWFELQNCDFQILPLDTLANVFQDPDPKEPNGLIYWLCTIFRRNLGRFTTAGSNVVLALCNICTDCCQTSPDVIQMVHQLLNIVSNRAYAFMLQRISGCTSVEVDDTASVFDNIKFHMINLWSSLLKERSACDRPTGNTMLCEQAIIHMYLSTLICSPTQVTAQALVHSSGLVYSCVEDANSIDKLRLLFQVMKVLANTAACEDVFELWADKLIGQVCTLTSDQAFNRVVLVANLVQLSSGKDLVSAGQKQGVTLGPSIAMHYYLLKALNRQWLPLLALLHWEKAWELRLMVVRVLQFLPPEKFANMRDIIFRLKGSLGLFLKWLDEAYGCKLSDKSMSYLSEDGNGIDEKWQFIQLVEKMKSVIVQLACSSKMTFALMVNSVLEYSFHETQGSLSEPTSNLVDICSISSHLGNLLRQTVAQINKAEESIGKNSGKFKPMSVLAELLVNHLQTPHEAFVSKEHYEEAYSKNSSSCDQIFLSDCFSRNPLLFEILEIILDNGDDNEVEQCMEFLRALLAYSIAYWNQAHPVRKNYCGVAFQGEGEEAARVQVCRLIQMMVKTNRICNTLKASAEIVSSIDRNDIPDLLQLLWNSLHHRKGAPISTSPGSIHPENGSDAEELKEEYLSILRRNIAQIGPHFASLHHESTL